MARGTARVAFLLAAATLLGSCVFGDSAQPLGDLAPLQVHISEIHYADPAREAKNEFVEIHNSGDRKVSLGDWCIEGVDFCFDNNVVIESGQYLATPSSAFGSRLSLDGETIRLVDSEKSVRDEVTYSDNDPWPVGAAGRGYSLQRFDPVRAGDDPGSWFGAAPTPNSAGDPASRLAVVADATLVVSEVHYHPPTGNPSERFIEVTNAAASTVSTKGWCIAETRWCLDPVDVTPGGFIVLDDPEAVAALSDAGGSVTLLRPDSSIAETLAYDNRGRWPALADGHGHSLQRRDARLSPLEPGNWESAPPTRGLANDVGGDGIVPLVLASTHTRSPAAGAPIPVIATIEDADSARLVWRIGFGEEQTSTMTVDAGRVATASIPGQPAGSLVRYRIVASNENGEGTWPRQGSGPGYDGTVVAAPSSTPLPVLQWFMSDADYETAWRDTDLYRDDGYPAVFAWDGEIMDNARIRVKGQQSRHNKKRKWKVALAPGDLWESEVLDTPVNEFSLQSATTDKSYVREILTSDLQEMSGGMWQQIFPLRLERNGEFYGLYMYQEQTDGRWRRKYGLSGNEVVYKGEKTSTLRLGHIEMLDFTRRYNRKTQRWKRDAMREIDDLIRRVNEEDESRLVAWTYAHVDVPQVVETLAVMRVAQHMELEHKNHVYVLDPADGRWRFIAIDFDLNFGRRWRGACQSFCDDVEASTYINYMQSNRLGRIFIEIPEFRRMVDRRTRTVAEQFLAPGLVEKRIAELAAQMSEDAALDRKAWGTYGTPQTMAEAQKLLLERYIVRRREQFLGDSTWLPGSQPADAATFLEVDTTKGTVTNTARVAVDLSGMTLTGLPAKVPSGVVLNPGQTVVFETAKIPYAEVPDVPTGAPATMRVWLPNPALR